MSTFTEVKYPVSPTAQKRRSTLLDVADVTDQFQWLDGLALFSSYNCLTFADAAEFCAPNTKTFEQTSNWVDGFRFAVYGGFNCKAIGRDADASEKVKAAFEIGESAAVESALMANRFVENDGSTLPGQWDAPEDINPSGAVSISVGIALLQEAAGNLYVGAPTLHVPISVASIQAEKTAFIWDGEILRTQLGAKVAVGAGYMPNTGPDGDPAATGERWLYATGEVWVGRSDEINLTEMDRSTNEVLTLAERGYIAAVDCFAVAVRVTV